MYILKKLESLSIINIYWKWYIIYIIDAVGNKSDLLKTELYLYKYIDQLDKVDLDIWINKRAGSNKS